MRERLRFGLDSSFKLPYMCTSVLEHMDIIILNVILIAKA